MKGEGGWNRLDMKSLESIILLKYLISDIYWFCAIYGASLIAQLVKNLPAMQETPVWFLGWEDPLEKGKNYPLQYFGLENSMDCIVRGVAESRTGLSECHFGASPMAQLVKNLPAMRETSGWFLV